MICEILLLLLMNPLNSTIDDKFLVDIPYSISFSLIPSEYSYRVIWEHGNGFNVIGQYRDGKLVNGFVLYTGEVRLKPGQTLNIYCGKLLKVGTAIYHKRLLHVFCFIIESEYEYIDRMYNYTQDRIKEFYGRF